MRPGLLRGLDGVGVSLWQGAEPGASCAHLLAAGHYGPSPYRFAMFALAVTDLRWHSALLAAPPDGPVNFWTPTPWKVSLEPGTRIGFLLKAPVRKIGGYGTLVAYDEGRVSEAWARFGTGNGVASFDELRERVVGFASRRSGARINLPDPNIGFMSLEGCVFLPEDMQVSPEDLGLSFPPTIVKWKGFDGELVLPFEQQLPDPDSNFQLVTEGELEWELRQAKKRIAQGPFRARVLEAYGNRCAVTGVACGAALDAAHIQPFMGLASHHVQNGIALRKDIHALFDEGLLALDDSLSLMVSPYLHDPAYQALAGQPLTLPHEARHRPSLEALRLHRHSVFRARSPTNES